MNPQTSAQKTEKQKIRNMTKQVNKMPPKLIQGALKERNQKQPRQNI